MKVQVPKVRRDRPFKFFNGLVEYEGFLNVVKEAWGKRPAAFSLKEL